MKLKRLLAGISYGLMVKRLVWIMEHKRNAISFEPEESVLKDYLNELLQIMGGKK